MSGKNTSESNGPFQRARLLGFEHGRIRRLQGFIKGAHHEPDRHSPAAEAFARKIGSSDLENRAEALHREIRRGFGFKRRELDYSCEEGSAIIRTPGFSVHLWVDQDPDEARCYRIGIEIDQIESGEVVTAPAFVDIFRHHCRVVQIDFSASIDLEATIDAIEDSPALAPLMDYAPDASWLTLKEPASSIEMHLLPHQVRFTMPQGGDLGALLEGTSSLLNDLAQAGAAPFQGFSIA
jgi:hypothetical protein